MDSSAEVGGTRTLGAGTQPLEPLEPNPWNRWNPNPGTVGTRTLEPLEPEPWNHWNPNRWNEWNPGTLGTDKRQELTVSVSSTRLSVSCRYFC